MRVCPLRQVRKLAGNQLRTSAVPQKSARRSWSRLQSEFWQKQLARLPEREVSPTGKRALPGVDGGRESVAWLRVGAGSRPARRSHLLAGNRVPPHRHAGPAPPRHAQYDRHRAPAKIQNALKPKLGGVEPSMERRNRFPRAVQANSARRQTPRNRAERLTPRSADDCGENGCVVRLTVA